MIIAAISCPYADGGVRIVAQNGFEGSEIAKSARAMPS